MAAICINALEGRHMSAYAAGNFTDAKDLGKSGRLFKRKNDLAAMSFPLQGERTMLKKWRCDTGLDITNNR
ncbi:hypothetical protein CIG23_23645 [Raoultella planticola]|nr:hypothetical protein CIG23_23645 [Raoultella planticola]